MPASPDHPPPAPEDGERPAEPAALAVHLLGRGQFMLGGEPLRLPYARAQALLLLLLEPAGQARERLTDLLWPEQGAATARNNLRHALHLLRRVLGEDRLQATRELIRLRRLEGDAVDLDQFAPATPTARPSAALTPAARLALLDEYQGELMAGFSLPNAPTFMDWLDRQRLAAHARVVATLERLHHKAQATQQRALQVAVARAQARVEPWGEEPHRRLMQALADDGRASEALAHWDLVRESFQRDLDAQPGAGLRALAQRLQAQAAGAGRPLPAAAALQPVQPPPTAPGPGDAPDSEAAALLHVECRALDPRDTAALAVIEAVHQALTLGSAAMGARLRASGGTSTLLRFDSRPGRQGPSARALRVALDARQAWRAHPASACIALRIGLHRGPLLAASEGRLDPLGQVAGVAAAVAGSGLAGDVLASPAFAQRVPGQDWVPLPRRAGVYGEAPLPVLRLAAADAASGPNEPALLGRSSQKAAVLKAWRRTRRSQARALLVVGAPGAGKSRLARWASQNLPDNTDPWLIDCLPSRREAPAAPLADLLARQCGLPPDCPPERAQPIVEAGLQRLVPALPAVSRQALQVLLGVRPDDPAWTPTQRRKDLLDAFVAVLQARLQRGPLLLVLEDLHWADATTLQAVELAVQRQPAAPLLVLATTRPQPENLMPAWTPLVVGPLEPAVAQALARQVLRQQGRAQPEPALLDDIARRSGGNPLFVEALAMAAAQSLQGPPPSLEDSLLGSLTPEPAARQLARAASVLGEAFSLSLLRALCADMDDDAYHAAWRQLLRHGLVQRHGGQGRFHHALVRDAAYASLGAELRRTLHARTVQAAQAEQADLAQTQPLWLARHAEHGAMLDAAIAWYEQAALQALGLAAFAEAAAHFAHALALTERLPATPEQQQRALRLALGRAHATVPVAGYGAEATRQAFRAVLDLGAGRAGSNEVFQAHYGLWLGSSSSGGYHLSELYAQRVQRHADASGDPVHRLQAAYAWGNTRLWLGELQAARGHLESAIALHAQLPPGALFPSYNEDTGVIARALLAWTLWLQGDETAALLLQQDSIALAESLGHIYSLAFALACAARLDVMRGDEAGVATASGRLLEIAQRHDLVLWQAVGGVTQGWLLAARGQPEGLELAARGVALAAPAMPSLDVTLLSMQADALYRSGDRAACAAVTAHALARCDHWSDRYVQPELLRLAALCTPDGAAAATLLQQGRTQALDHGAVAWLQRLDAHAMPAAPPSPG